jgi:hypothetical protein
MSRVVWVVVAVAAALVVAAGLALGWRERPWSSSEPRAATEAASSRVGAGTAVPRSEPGRPAPRRGRIAVIVDELGAREDVVERLIALGRPVTLAVLPGLPLSRRITREATRAGLEVLVQLPLEPYRFPEVDPGPGVLLTSMSPDEVTRRTRQQLQGLPGTAGVLTGMGSRFTEDRVRMRALLEPVFLQGSLFFVDSWTSQRSVGYDLARVLGIPAARRQVFLDPDESEATMRGRLLEAERRAERHGTVIAVGHGRLLTVGLLEEALPRWESLGHRLVPVSHLVGEGARGERRGP